MRETADHIWGLFISHCPDFRSSHVSDNYIEGNIAGGSSHYGFWFFPEAHVVGASSREKGAGAICPPEIPILRFADNEAHNNRKFGFRLSGGGSGVGLWPRRNPCWPITEENPYITAQFVRLYAWRNSFNGVFVGNVAATHFIDFVVADNGWRNIEFPGVRPTGEFFPHFLSVVQGFDGGWGAVALIRPLIVGHDLPCPHCDRDPALIHWGMDPGDATGAGTAWHSGNDMFGNIFDFGGWDGPVADSKLWWKLKDGKFGSCAGLEMRGSACSGRDLANKLLGGGAGRIGIATPSTSGLYVYGAKFINYDRPGMVAIMGAGRNCQNCPYGFRIANGAETRFRKTTWLESDYRVRWRFVNEALYTDLDGTFADQPFCKGCSVVLNKFMMDSRSIPEWFVIAHINLRAFTSDGSHSSYSRLLQPRFSALHAQLP